MKEELATNIKQINYNLASVIDKSLEPIKKEMREIKDSMTFMSNRFDEIEYEQASTKKVLKDLQSENIKLTRVVDLTHRINYIEQQSRSNNLEIQCVPEYKNENILTIVKQLGSVVGCK